MHVEHSPHSVLARTYYPTLPSFTERYEARDRPLTYLPVLEHSTLHLLLLLLLCTLLKGGGESFMRRVHMWTNGTIVALLYLTATRRSKTTVMSAQHESLVIIVRKGITGSRLLTRAR